MKRVQVLILLAVFVLAACSSDESVVVPGTLTLKGEIDDFRKVGKNAPSEAQYLNLKGDELDVEVVAEVTGEFEISENGINYTTKIILSPEKINQGKRLYVRCNAVSLGELNGTLSIVGTGLSSHNYELNAIGVEKLHFISTFQNTRHAFGNGKSKRITESFDFPTDPTKVESITMYVKLKCPAEGCNAWDVYANVRVQDPITDDWWEIGRYITPYGVDNSQVARGFPIDVTAFKSVLTGEVNLQSFIEVWGADGWLLSLDFEVIEGTPDYPYYAVSPLLDYAQNALAGIPYGVEHDFDLEKCVTIPAGAEETAIRTIITGWGHATPIDTDGRPCAEWCFRTHDILINDAALFQHEMKGIACDVNKVQPQNGNWQPDRAGWCPGMEVPVRTNVLDYARAGESFCYKYQLEPWVNDMQSTADNKNAYYAISSFIVVKSKTPIEPATAG